MTDSLELDPKEAKNLPESSFGFPRKLRLLKGADFKTVFSKASRSRDDVFTVLMRPNTLGHPRLGLAISKKELRRAVDRNRVKRLCRENFRLQQAVLGSNDFVIMSRRRALDVDNAELSRRLKKNWRRLTLPKKASSASSKRKSPASQTKNSPGSPSIQTTQ